MEIIKPTKKLYNWNHLDLEVFDYPYIEIKTLPGYFNWKGKIDNKKLPAKLDWCSGIFKCRIIREIKEILEIEIYDSKKYENPIETKRKFVDLTRPHQIGPDI